MSTSASREGAPPARNPFELDEGQQALLRATRDFGRTLNDGLSLRDRDAVFPRDLWRRCAEFGILGLPIPLAYGGAAQDLRTTLAVMTELGYACRDNGLVFSLNAQLWAFQLPLLHFGTEEQRQAYLPRVVRGELIGAHAITEPEHGSDVMSMAMRARRDGDDYVLDGSKTFITNGPVADVVLAFATVDPAMKAAGVTAFLVERGTPGMTLSGAIPKMGLRSSPMGEIAFSGCRVPRSARLGREGEGVVIFNHSMEWERTCIFAAHIGAMKRLLEDTVAYARSRRQFGQPISRHDAVAERLVDMKVAIEAGELLLWKAAALKDAGQSAVLAAAIAKLFVSEAHVRHALDALRIHGGNGYCTEYGIEREVRDAIPGTIYSGTSEMQRKIIARLLGL